MIAYFVRHPTAANLLMLAIILLGLLGMRTLTREVFPDFVSNYVNVRVVYKGAAAEEVEETICQRIEEEIEGVEGIEEIKSFAREGVGLVTVEVADGYEVGQGAGRRGERRRSDRQLPHRHRAARRLGGRPLRSRLHRLRLVRGDAREGPAGPGRIGQGGAAGPGRGQPGVGWTGSPSTRYASRCGRRPCWHAA